MGMATCLSGFCSQPITHLAWDCHQYPRVGLESPCLSVCIVGMGPFESCCWKGMVWLVFGMGLGRVKPNAGSDATVASHLREIPTAPSSTHVHIGGISTIVPTVCCHCG